MNIDRTHCSRSVTSLAGRAVLSGGLAISMLIGAAHADDVRVSDESVDLAIVRAVRWLKERKNEDGNWETSGMPVESREHGGRTALALLALLYAGEDQNSAEISKPLAWLATQDLAGTYAYGLRAHVLALLSGRKYRSRLEGDLDWLVRAPNPRGAQGAGGYGYSSSRGRGGGIRWDNSNSQYGVLGAWMATDAGLKPSTGSLYWELMRDHWLRTQRPDGGWGYTDFQESNGSMTAAGVATLFVVLDRLHAGNMREARGLQAAIDNGLDWLGREFTTDNPRGNSQWRYYYLYGVERVGRASGFKYFRRVNWFREGARYLLKHQHDDGHWAGTSGGMSDTVNTAYALMFLCHGRAPLLFNKLEFGSDWNGKLRDVAGLTWMAQQSLERLLNWQIVHLDGPLDDLFDAPVLYLYGTSEVMFSNAQVQKLREYCLRGGMIYAVAGENSTVFVDAIEQLARRAFPEYRTRPIHDDHPLVSGRVQYPIKDPPFMIEVHNGVRTLMILSTRDVADAWNRHHRKGKGQRDFRLGLNVYLYATDKAYKRSRLETIELPRESAEIKRTVQIGRIRYDGTWDVEPYGWTRLRTYLHNETGTRLLVTSGVRLDRDDLIEQFRVLHMTGTEAFDLSAAEREGLRKFLSSGGTLLADAAGGSRSFLQAFEREMQVALGGKPRVLPESSPILTGQGIDNSWDLSLSGLKRAALGWTGNREYPPIKAFALGRRWAVVYSPIDVSVGLLGTEVFGCRGFDDYGALQVLRNLILYANLPAVEKARLYDAR